MAQKTSNKENELDLLNSIDPEGIADESTRRTVEILLNIVERLSLRIKNLELENQQLRDENNRLKGEQGKPDIKGKTKKGFNNQSSEKERHEAKKHQKGSKNDCIKIDREEILEYPAELLPSDAQFKGYEEVIVQDVKLTGDNVLFRKQKYYSPLEGKTYLAELPPGYAGEFGPGLKTLVLSLYYGGNMTQGKLLEFLEDLGVKISAGYLSNLLIKNQDNFEQEKNQVYEAGLNSSPWHNFDQTGARVGGVNHTTNVLCNPLYTIYWTTLSKDRLTVLQGLQNQSEPQFILNRETFTLLDSLGLAEKWQKALTKLPQEIVLNQDLFNILLDRDLPTLGPRQRTRILDAAAIAFYHQQTRWPIIKALVCDDAPQFKLITDILSLCWVHEGRHYKKLSPVVAYHQRVLKQFLDDFWDYYRDLRAYQRAPSEATAEVLRAKFIDLFSGDSVYQALDERKRLTLAKMSELLPVLVHPELPLHNNAAELAARTMVQRRNISYATQTTEGTKAWDTFMSLVATTRKLGISFFEYMRDRIYEINKLPALATIIREKSALNPFGQSWQLE
jgi:hypothetical protein